MYFHGHGYDLISPPKLLQLRKSVDQQQIWIWYIQEPPTKTYYDPQSYNGIFNWSATYSTKSEIFVPYSETRLLTPDELKRKGNEKTNFAAGKDKMAFVAMSKCRVSARLELVKRLGKYVPVDVYGRCKFDLKLESCPKNSAKCQSIRSRYKFYFAVKNSMCEDYITEKYWGNLRNGLVPIVFSGANYSRLALPGTFINARDFKSLKELADHLERRHSMCRVCEALWNPELKSKRFLNLGQLWGRKTMCEDIELVMARYS